jgi:transcriptional regulator with XRE-family HTH domain
MNFRKMLVNRRLADGMTRAEVARKIGIGESSLCKIENGTQTVGPAIAAKLAAAGFMSIEEIMLAQCEENIAAAKKINVTRVVRVFE